jgi:DMSO reductase anchor subunit
MLTFLPMAVGFSVASHFIGTNSSALERASLAAGFLGLGASIFHLGKPLRAWKVFLGLRKSWLSREAVIFGAWFGLAALQETARSFLPQLVAAHRPAAAAFTWVVSAMGAAGLCCSIMIYVDTRRGFWRLASTGPRFLGTAALFGAFSLFVIEPGWSHVALLAGLALAKLAVETRVFRTFNDDDCDSPTVAQKTALILSGPLRTATGLRYLFTFFGAVALPLCIADQFLPGSSIWLAAALAFGGELTERYSFFRAVVAPKMPGVATT